MDSFFCVLDSDSELCPHYECGLEKILILGLFFFFNLKSIN